MTTLSIPTPYAEAHSNPNGPGDARPTAFQILKDNDLLGDKLVDKTILVTGGTDGLGLETVRQLIKTGAQVFFTARNEEKAKKVLQELEESAKAESRVVKCDWVRIDNESLQSVKAGAEEFLRKSRRLNVLICNAGIAHTPFGLTKDGFELQFGVNYLAHFHLFHLLKPTLLASSTSSFQSRVIAVSSAAHGFSTVHIGNYNLLTKPTDGFDPLIALPGSYNEMIGYGQSKTAMIWFANEIERRYGSRGLHGISLHPGNIVTAMFEKMEPRVAELLMPYFEMEVFQKVMKSVEQGAATQVLAAVGGEYEGKGGFYMEDCKVGRPLGEDEQLGVEGYRAWAFDREGEERLWKDSLEMVGLKDE